MNHGIRLTMADAGLELRLITVADVPVNALPAPSDEERARADRFRFAAHRRRYLLGRFMVRAMLADWSGMAPGALRFGETGKGKPILLDDPGLHFNLSYAQDAVLVGITRRGPIGVDVETRRLVPDALDLAGDIFDAPERRALQDGQSATAQSDLFLLGWTRKEACLKAVAEGLSLDPSCVPTGVDMSPRTVVMANLPDVRLETMMTKDRILSWAIVI